MAPQSEEKKAEAEINRIRKLPDNKVCANCLAPGTPLLTAVVMKYKIFVCSMCKSAHQSFSHRCKSTQMSVWTMEECRALEDKNGGGNRVARDTWLARCKDSDRPREGDKLERFKDFVEAAYERKKWYEGDDDGGGGGGREARRGGRSQREDDEERAPRRRDERGSGDAARGAPPGGGRRAPAPTMDLFDPDAGSTPARPGGGGSFDPNAGRAAPPNGGRQAPAPTMDLFDIGTGPTPGPGGGGGGGGGGFDPNAGASSGSFFDPNAGGGAQSLSFDPFVGAPAAPQQQAAAWQGSAGPQGGGGFNPHAGAPAALATSGAGGGSAGFDDFGFDSFVSAPASGAAQPGGMMPGVSAGGFNPNANGLAAGASAQAPVGGCAGMAGPMGSCGGSAGCGAAGACGACGGGGGCGGAPGASGVAAALWGNPSPGMGAPVMPAGGGMQPTGYAALGGGYSQMQQQAPWPQQPAAAFGAQGGMGQPQNRFAALGAPSGPQQMGPAGAFPHQGAPAQAMWGQPGGCPGQAFGAQGAAGVQGGFNTQGAAGTQGGFNPSAPAQGPGNVQDLQRSLQNLYDIPGGQAAKGPPGGSQGAFPF